jgi:DNA invertase Pin-like site-specific DNA recombinase
VDKGVSGAKDKRPALDQLVADARRRRFDVLVVWRLDRLGRNLRHLILLLDELNAVGVAFVSLGEGIDTATPAGGLQLHILGAHCGVRTRPHSGARPGRPGTGPGAGAHAGSPAYARGS